MRGEVGRRAEATTREANSGKAKGKTCNCREFAKAPTPVTTHALLVDPPRAGLDQTTLSLVQKFDQVLYISCNPATLRENLRASGLEGTHAVRKFALFDHFPYTPHLECGVWLARRCVET